MTVAEDKSIQSSIILITSIAVVLDFIGGKEIIDDINMPIRFLNNDQDTKKILLKPIIDFIIDLGKQLQGQ